MLAQHISLTSSGAQSEVAALMKRLVIPTAGMIPWPAIAMRHLVTPHPGVIDSSHVAFAVLHHRASPYAVARRSSNLLRFDTGTTEALQFVPRHHALNHRDLGRVVVLRRRHQHRH